MKTIFTLFLFAIVAKPSSSQVVINELYTDPGSGKHEFFELYNTSPASAPFSVDNLTMVTYFNISGSKGFYVMDLPNMTIAARSYFVGAAASPFNYQANSNSTAVDFSWNSASFTANNGSIKKWVLGGLNILDGNLSYDQASVPANFNDFFYRITGSGASYSVFLYNNGQLINSFIGGSGGMTTVTSEITSMPPLFVDMSSTSPDFTINFSGYGSIPIEYCGNDAGSDNGYSREFDGGCASWKKSSSSIQHTPRASNGTLIGASTGSVSVSVATWQGNSTTGSVIFNDVVSAPSSYFPISLQLYTDLGSVWGKLDATDTYVQTNTENTITDGPFYTHFAPFDANILIAVKTNAGCFDKILFVPNTIVLSTKLISFTGSRAPSGINLRWHIENNESVDHFQLERSEDGLQFSAIALIMSEEEGGQKTYEYKDGATGKNVVYRIRIFNRSGKVDISNTVSFVDGSKDNNSLRILSNPANSSVNFSYSAISNSALQVQVMDMNGKQVMRQSLSVQKGNNAGSLSLPMTMSPGTYLLTVTDANGSVSQRFVKQ
jgi:hypothetical protein